MTWLRQNWLAVATAVFALVVVVMIALGGAPPGGADLARTVVLNPYEFGQTKAVPLDATRRLVIAVEPSGGAAAGQPALPKVQFCAEPPPDATASIAAVLSQSVDLSVDASDMAEFNAKTLALSSLLSNAENIFNRSQGIQALRDGMYRLCEGVANGVIGKGEFISQMSGLVATLNFVVPIEICTNFFRDVNEGRRIDPDEAEGMPRDFTSGLLQECLQKGQEFAMEMLKYTTASAEFALKTAQIRLDEASRALDIERERTRQLELLQEPDAAPPGGPVASGGG